MDLENFTPSPLNVISFPTSAIRGKESTHEIGSADGRIGPIEQQMRSKLAKFKDCRYPDEFDWSVYDRIAAKYDEPPRGGVVFNTTFKLANWHPTCTKCHYAFEIDTYGRGCVHDCIYCYAKDQLTTYGYWNRPQPFPVNLASIREIFYKVFETSQPTKWRPILEKRVPLRIGSMSDSFMWMDTRYGVTKELLRILRYYRYPYIIFTRSDLVAHDDYRSLLEKDLAAVQFSISGNNHQICRYLEPGAPSYKRRLIAIKKLIDSGIWTSVRINPLFPRYPDGFFSDQDHIVSQFGSKSNVPTFDLYNDEFVPELASVGVRSILAGFVRISGNAVKNIEKSTGINLKPFFRKELSAKNGNSESRYSDAEIGAYYRWFADMARKSEIRFTTCYIGMGLKDYFQYQDLWSNKRDCCDVVGNVGDFRSSSQSIPWTVRERHTTRADLVVSAKKIDEETCYPNTLEITKETSELNHSLD